MSNEPENRIVDPKVTDAYQTLARERTPEHLDEKVLERAAAIQTPYARARAWMRPAAWAATIGLSLAIVLDLTQMPSTDTDYRLTESTGDMDTPESRGAVLDDPASAPARADTGDASANEKTERSGATTEAKRRAQEKPAPQASDIRVAEEFAPREATVLRDAEALARTRAGSDEQSKDTRDDSGSGLAFQPLSEPLSAEPEALRRAEADRQVAKRVSAEARSAAVSLAAASDADAPGPACPADVRESESAWLACIRELRENGQDEIADKEFEEFRRVFPEIADSDTD